MNMQPFRCHLYYQGWFRIPSVKEGEKSFILLEQIIEKNISKLFLGQ